MSRTNVYTSVEEQDGIVLVQPEQFTQDDTVVHYWRALALNAPPRAMLAEAWKAAEQY